jgi:amino acid transporter
MDPRSEKAVVTECVSHGIPADENISEPLGSAVASNGNLIDDGLQRGLKGRHLQMIALGGVVGYVLANPRE